MTGFIGVASRANADRLQLNVSPGKASSVKIKRPYALEFNDESRTKQSFKNEANINNIMARYNKTGVIDHLNSNAGSYGDFSTANSYQDSLNLIISAQNMFDDLPAKIRKRFGNDPALFIEFVDTPGNLQELVEMGLASPEAVDASKKASQDAAPAKDEEKPTKQHTEAPKGEKK